MLTTITRPPGKRVESRPTDVNPVKEFGRQRLGPPPMVQPTGVKLECAAGSIKIRPESNSFRLVRQESIALELALPKTGGVSQCAGGAGPWDALPGASPDASAWSVSVLVGQLNSAVYPTAKPFSVMTDPNAIKGAIRYALNSYEQQLNRQDHGTEPYFRTKDKIDLVNAVCLTDRDTGKVHATAHYAFRIPHIYGLVSEIAMQLTLNYAVYETGVSEFWVNATEFRPGATQIARHHAGPDYIIHAHQIAISACLGE